MAGRSPATLVLLVVAVAVAAVGRLVVEVEPLVEVPAGVVGPVAPVGVGARPEFAPVAEVVAVVAAVAPEVGAEVGPQAARRPANQDTPGAVAETLVEHRVEGTRARGSRARHPVEPRADLQAEGMLARSSLGRPSVEVDHELGRLQPEHRAGDRQLVEDQPRAGDHEQVGVRDLAGERDQVGVGQQQQAELQGQGKDRGRRAVAVGRREDNPAALLEVHRRGLEPDPGNPVVVAERMETAHEPHMRWGRRTVAGLRAELQGSDSPSQGGRRLQWRDTRGSPAGRTRLGSSRIVVVRQVPTEAQSEACIPGGHESQGEQYNLDWGSGRMKVGCRKLSEL